MSGDLECQSMHVVSCGLRTMGYPEPIRFLVWFGEGYASLNHGCNTNIFELTEY